MKKIIFILPLLALIISGCSLNKIKPVQQKLFDEKTWQVIDKKSADLEGDGVNEDVYYLKSLSVMGYGGLEQEEYGVKMIIAKNNNEVFELSPSENKDHPTDYWTMDFFHPDNGEISNFYLDDITGDNIPEVMLRTTFEGVSDSSHCLYMITYDKKQKIYHKIDVGFDKFCSSVNYGLEIYNLIPEINGKQIITATPADKGACHICPQPFIISIYTWNGYNFTLYKSYTVQKNYDGAAFALDGEKNNLYKEFNY